MYISRSLSGGSNSTDKYVDGNRLSNEQICELFDHIYRTCHEANETREDYYCGITNNIAQNKSRHGVSHLICVKCKDKDTAAKVENMLGDMDYDIGDPQYEGNGSADDTVYVYMCHKTSDFKK